MARIMVVDDAEITRATICDLAKSKGHEIVGEAATAEEAIEVFKDSRPEVVLLDFIIPGPPCDETIAEMRRIHPASKILLITAVRKSSVDSKLGEKVSADSFLPKPFQGAQLAQAIEDVLKT